MTRRAGTLMSYFYTLSRSKFTPVIFTRSNTSTNEFSLKISFSKIKFIKSRSRNHTDIKYWTIMQSLNLVQKIQFWYFCLFLLFTKCLLTPTLYVSRTTKENTSKLKVPKYLLIFKTGIRYSRTNTGIDTGISRYWEFTK